MQDMLDNYDNELDINHFATCIEAINNVSFSNIPEADELKKIVNGWIDGKLNDAFADKSISLKLFTGWNKIVAQAGAEETIRIIHQIDEMPATSDPLGWREIIHGLVSDKLNEALSTPESRLLLFKILLGLRPVVVTPVDRITLTDEHQSEVSEPDTISDQSGLNATSDDQAEIPSRHTVDLSKTNWPWS